MLRNLRSEFELAVRTQEPLIRVDTDDVTDCLHTLGESCRRWGWEMRVYDPLVGVKWYSGTPDKPPTAGKPTTVKTAADLLNAVAGDEAQVPPTTVHALTEFWREPARPDTKEGAVRNVILVVKNLHLGFERGREAMVTVLHHLATDQVGDHPNYAGPQGLRVTLYDPKEIPKDVATGKFVVGLMPAEATIPPEINPLFKSLVHELPDEDELQLILDSVQPPTAADEGEDNAQSLAPETRRQICKFARGLTRLQAEGVFAAAQIRGGGRVSPEYVWTEKSRILNTEGLVELYQGKETFRDVAGLTGMKEMIRNLLTPDEFDDADPDVRAKGVLACGCPGVGKSLIAKAAGNELGLPVLLVNPGNWMGRYVGDSEAKTRKGLQILRAHAPCVAVMDEVEKVMPSSRGAGRTAGSGPGWRGPS